MPEPVVQPTIVLATHEFAPFRGGVATYVQEIASAAAGVGLPVEVWTVDYRGRLDGTEKRGLVTSDSSLAFPVVRFASNGRLTPAGLWGLGRGFWRRRSRLRAHPVILLSVGAQMVFFVLAELGVLPARRVTCFLYGSELLRFGQSVFWRTLARRFYARAAGFAVLTPAIERMARESGLLPPGAPILIAPGALPSAYLLHVEQNSVVPPAVESDPPDPPDHSWRVLTVARLHPRKGQLEVARALALLPAGQRERVIYQMVGVGEDDYRQQVEAACREGGVRCQFLGAVDDASLGAVYRDATVYAQASLTLPNSIEGFGLSFLEASFHSCPVAAYRSGGVEEVVREGETGFLVPEGDRAGLAAAVSRLLDDPTLRHRLGDAGRTFARVFSWEASARALCEAAAWSA